MHFSKHLPSVITGSYDKTLPTMLWKWNCAQGEIEKTIGMTNMTKCKSGTVLHGICSRVLIAFTKNFVSFSVINFISLSLTSFMSFFFMSFSSILLNIKSIVCKSIRYASLLDSDASRYIQPARTPMTHHESIQHHFNKSSLEFN